MAEPVFFVLCLIAVFALAMQRAPLWLWAAALASATLIWQTEMLHGEFDEPDFTLMQLLAWMPVVVLAGLSIPPLRRAALIEPIFRKVKGILPKVSDTEQEALDAGTIGFDAELFSGTPDWDKLRAVPPIVLTPEEQAFLDGPTAELCRMIDDWQIRHDRARDPRADLGLRQEARLPRHAHLQGARRARLLGAGAVADPRQDRLALARRVHASSWCRTRWARAS